MRHVSVGLVGLGTIAQTQHLPNLALLSALFRVVAVADLSSKLTTAIADGLRGPVFTSTDWRDVCARPEVEAVLLLTPGAHQQMTEEALGAGKHVFSEKPLSLTVAGAEHLAALADRTDRVLQVGYMKVHEEAFAGLVAGLETIGEHRLIRHTVYHPSHRSQHAHGGLLRFDDVDPGALEADVAYQSGQVAQAIGDLPRRWDDLYRKFLVGSVIHTASLLRASMGELPRITHAEMWPPAPAGSASQPSSLFFRGELSNQTPVEVSWLWLPSFPAYRETLEVHGTEGSAEMSFPQPYLRRRTAQLTIRHPKTPVRHLGGSETAFVRELRAFHAAVATGQRPRDAHGSAIDLAWLQEALADLAGRAAVTIGGEAVATRR
ncbi:MAG: Gfo/Idh/MocA family oxidoreductase [bacterium]|nr:Gfo/Idh/MocA family oxidoreductase [bacterium]